MPISGRAVPRVALVTGASRGIGRVVARCLAERGYSVAVNYRQAEAEAESLVRELRALGVQAEALQADVADPRQARALVCSVEGALGPLEVLVNNAGVTRDRLLIQMSEDDWAATWMTDLAGARAAALAAAGLMTGRGHGRIVNVGSVVGVTGNSGQANYAAAKSALMGLTRQLAVQCGPSGVTVNCVVPGYIETDATSHLTPEQRAGWLKRIPMGRYAQPDEVASVIVFLACDGAAYITGQCLAVDGGLLAASGAGLSS